MARHWLFLKISNITGPVYILNLELLGKHTFVKFYFYFFFFFCC